MSWGRWDRAGAVLVQKYPGWGVRAQADPEAKVWEEAVAVVQRGKNAGHT